MSRCHVLVVLSTLALLACQARRPAAGEPGIAPSLHRIEVAGGTIDVLFEEDAEFVNGRPLVLAWVERSAMAVADYYGEFPVDHARVLILPTGGYRVHSGTATGRGGPTVRIAVGKYVDEEVLQRDWKMTHEMVHLAFPRVPRDHHWMEEGLATYVEPFARAGIGTVTPEAAWADQVWGMPKGQPQHGDAGLDHTPTWGRTYWGGALFCLVADVQIREKTDNVYGLRDALRAVVAEGGTMEQQWSLQRALEIGDEAVGQSVLQDLYERWRATPVEVDLATMWAELGVEETARGIHLRDDAPLAPVRRAISCTRPACRLPPEL